MDREWQEMLLDNSVTNGKVTLEIVGRGEFEIGSLGPNFILSVEGKRVVAMKGQMALDFCKDALAGAASRATGFHVAPIPQTGEAVEAPQGPKLGSEKHSQPTAWKPSGEPSGRGLTLLQRCEEALVWASGAQDFQPSNRGHDGWQNFVRPLLDEVRKANAAPYQVKQPRTFEDGAQAALDFITVFASLTPDDVKVLHREWVDHKSQKGWDNAGF